MKITTLILLVICSAASYAEPRLFYAEYVAKFDGLPIRAKGVRQLDRVNNNEYRLTSSATSILAKITETSTFTVTGDRLEPHRYDYSRGGLGKNRKAFLAFDYSGGNLLHEDGTSELIAGTLDKLSYQYQLRLDLAKLAACADSADLLEYTVADGDKLKHYEFRLAGEEVLDTPVGALNTVRLERVRENDSDRQTTFWLAKDHDYLLTRFKQEESGKGFELNLQSFSFEP